MKVLLFAALIFITTMGLNAQELKNFNLYKPKEDAARAIEQAVNQASTEKKHVFIQIGGNWCIWCARFNLFTKQQASIDSILNASYVVYHLNYSKENKNLEILKKYSFPQRFGFPVFLILNEKGDLLHIQNSAYLEDNKGYSKTKVLDFLAAWAPEALNPSNYQE